MALLAVVDKHGDIQTFDTDDGNMFVMALSLAENFHIFKTVATNHERARDNPGTTNNVMHVFSEPEKINTADKDSEHRRRMYRARDVLAKTKNFRSYMGEVVREPDGKDRRTEALLVPSNRLILPGGA